MALLAAESQAFPEETQRSGTKLDNFCLQIMQETGASVMSDFASLPRDWVILTVLPMLQKVRLTGIVQASVSLNPNPPL